MEKGLEVSQEQIDAWVKQYGEIILIEVAEGEIELDPDIIGGDLEDQPMIKGYISRPDEKVMNFALQKMPMFLDAGKVIMKNCWLGGDRRLIEDTDYLNSAAMVAARIVKVRQGKLKKISRNTPK